MKKTLVHLVLGLFLLAGFASSGFAQWEKTNWSEPSSFFDFYINQDNIIAQTWDVSNGSRAFLTSDNGANWTQISVADSSKEMLSLVIIEDDILAGTWDGLISASVGSTDWTPLTPTGISADSAISSLAMVNSTLYAGALGTIYNSTDNGAAWTEVNTGIPADARINSFTGIGSVVFAGSNTSGVFMSADAGANWTAINDGLSDLHISQMISTDDRLYVVTLKGGAYTTNDNGTTWTAINLDNITCLAVAGDDLYAGTDTEGLFMSSDNGANWNPVINTGMPDNTRIISMVASSNYLIAGASVVAESYDDLGGSVWRVPISTIVLPVESDNIPESYVLDRNYPNPFNPTTTIGFTIPASGKVTLSIYNNTGQKVRTLVDATMTSGAHNVVWDGLNDAGVRVPSGVYLYELRAGTFHDAKKLLLMK